ncbi:Hsp20/alpha crystallin family protein [Amycolatopsis echigonensis]|uniref:HSP20 family protein n=1 Tax=Amycolatopsis echigonensis TaxID=2576905 RepID=A0A2N3WHL7_9PSEU|nr:MULTISPECIES: Hsp20/alpha crystallin family protein [Amycolatopsis]MBB2501702.1 Hsp20/alpha crystallin family protein [Amycolatopsis echigonensis]PKV93354.1 HSP20 family protein [Amycolatopsis niigatensis]
MLIRTDPFAQFDRLTQQFFGGQSTAPRAVPMDAYRAGDEYVIQFDLPGIARDSIDVSVERNVLTVRAERTPVAADDAQVQVSERPRGKFSRQLFLGDTLDTARIAADYVDGVLTLRIPVAEKAQPRKITVGGAPQEIDA